MPVQKCQLVKTKPGTRKKVVQMKTKVPTLKISKNWLSVKKLFKIPRFFLPSLGIELESPLTKVLCSRSTRRVKFARVDLSARRATS